jgi:hypothetical protein
MILILSSDTDAHADAASERLASSGVRFHRFDPARLPASAQLSVHGSPSTGVRCTLRDRGETIDLSTVSAVWARRPGQPAAAPEIADPMVAAYVSAESHGVLESVWQLLDARWVPGRLTDLRTAEHKAYQLAVAQASGFELPPTLVTNDPDELLDFGQAHNWELVSKLHSDAVSRSFKSRFQRFTERFSPRDLAAIDAVRLCPLIFQAYVPKQLELRVTVVGQRVFAAEIHSQQTRHTRTDWRRYDFYGTTYAPHVLPTTVAAACLELTRRLRLCFGAIDLVLTPEGRYVFLEINPAGQYLWVEDTTGLPITDAICDELVAAERGTARLLEVAA